MIRTVTRLTMGAAGTAYGAARHPIGTAARTVGFVKGLLDVGTGVVRGATGHAGPVTATDPTEASATADVPGVATQDRAASAPARVPVDVPDPDDLPEPIVIHADDAPAAGTGEEFHTEPKAGSRASTHGAGVGDREEVEGYLEEAVLPDQPDVDIETPVGTTGAEVAHNPSTAESDLQQPGTQPLLDPATAKALRAEAETLQKAADPRVE